MSNLLIDTDKLAELRQYSVDAPHAVNGLVHESQSVIAKGGKVILNFTLHEHTVQLGSASTPEELSAFIKKHFPAYAEELSRYGLAFRGHLIFAESHKLLRRPLPPVLACSCG